MYLMTLVTALFVGQVDKKQDLNKMWKEGPAFETMFKKLPPTAKIKDDMVTLKNRGLLLSKAEYKNGFRLSFTWQWVEGEGSYPDILAVALKTDGAQRAWPGEIDNGIVVRFGPRRTAIEHWKSGEDGDPNPETKDFAAEKNTTYKIVIEEKDGDVSVTINDVQLRRRIEGVKNYRIAIFNREPTAMTLHESWIQDLRLTPKK